MLTYRLLNGFRRSGLSTKRLTVRYTCSFTSGINVNRLQRKNITLSLFNRERCRMSTMASVEAIPVLYIVAKNNYDVGYTIGSTIKHWISEYLKISPDVKAVHEFYSHDKGRDVVNQYLANAEKYHPRIVSEIRGLADGAGQDFMDIFLLQIVSEITLCHVVEIGGSIPNALDQPPQPKGCTDVLLNAKTCRVIGHNEDWTPEMEPYVCLVHVTIDGDGVKEQFVSFLYPGFLPGFCFSMNKDLVITLDSLLPKQSNLNGVPLMVLLRSLLSCSTIQECKEQMECKPVGSAYGMAINIAAIHGEDMCSMEVYPEEDKSRLQTKYVTCSDVTSNTCWFEYHQNSYKYIDRFNETVTRDAARRAENLGKMTPPENVNDVIGILGNVDDKENPVYRDPERGFGKMFKTAAVSVFDITGKKLLVYRSNPREAKRPCVTLPFF